MPDISVATWAKSVGISRQSAYDAVKRCGIPVSGGKVDADVATMLYRKKTRARANEKAPAAEDPPEPPRTDNPIDAPGAIPNYQESRARREAAEADKAEMAVETMRKTLIEKAPALAEWAKQTAAVREGLLNIPARLAPVLAAETSAVVVQQLLDTEIRAVVAQFVGGV